jgi:pycsar effector protein
VTAFGLRLPPRGGTLPRKPPIDKDRATQFAWRVHRAQVSWAGNADVKASILLALEGGAVYAVTSALGDGGFLARLGGRLYPIPATIGIFALLLAIAAGSLAIFPRLGQKDKVRDRGRQVIYFGDLRRWSAARLTSHIAGLTEGEELDMLSRQLTEMSKHNWVKHRWVQISLILSLTGILIIAVSAVTSL